MVISGGTRFLSQTGRSNDSTDPSGFYNVQCQVNLYPKKEWKFHIIQDRLIEQIHKQLRQYLGIGYNPEFVRSV